jgi:tryptophan synthase, alpha subunit
MNRIDRRFKKLKAQKKKAFIAYITAGDPNLTVTQKLVLELEKSGVDIVELGIPFSDPMADGPVIQAASQRALAGGTTLSKIFKMAKSLRSKTEMPIVFMTYYNPVLRHGVSKFFDQCRRSGVDGVIVPDLPCEEASELIKAGQSSGVATIFLAAPTSTLRRIKEIAKRSKGFIYYVSLTGVTGVRNALPSDIAKNLRRIKSVTDKPVAVGFGVSNPAQAAGLARNADGVIVGSAIVKMIGKDKSAIIRVAKLAKSLARAIHNV